MGRPLQGRAALVTGAGTRVGRAIAEHLGTLGADVVVHCFSSVEGAQAAVSTLKVDGNRAAAVRFDLAQDDPGALIGLAAAEVGPLSILVNSAGVIGERYTPDQLWRLNARAPLALTESFAAHAATGDVVNVIDIAGHWAHWREQVAYCMSKAAAHELTRCMALRLAPRIRVNAVAPGTVLPSADLPPEALEQLRRRIPQQRLGSAHDVAQTVGLLLAAPAFVTGQVVAVDGGRCLA